MEREAEAGLQLRTGQGQSVEGRPRPMSKAKQIWALGALAFGSAAVVALVFLRKRRRPTNAEEVVSAGKSAGLGALAADGSSTAINAALGLPVEGKQS